MVAYLTCIVLVIIGIRFFKWNTYNDDYLSKSQSNSIRGLLAIMIVFHHISQGMDLSLYGYPLFQISGPLIVALFFFYSGYGLLYSYIHKKDYMKNFIVKRIPSIYIPFVSANFLYLMFHICILGTTYSPVSFIKCLLGINLVNGIFWYIWILLLFYVIFYVLFTSFSLKKAMYSMTIFIVGFIVTLASTKGMGNYWYISSPAFIVGIFVCFKEREVVQFIKKHYIFFLPNILFVTIFCLMYILGIKISFGNMWIWHSVNLGITVVLSFLLITILLKCRIENFILSFLGMISLELYLLHPLIIDVLTNMGVAQHDPYLFLLLALEISIIVAYLIHLLNKLFIKKIC